MNELREHDDTSRPAAVATIGVFDGVHRGHCTLLDLVKQRAREHDAITVAMTFARHPLAVLAPNRCPPSLTTLRQRAQLLKAQGIERVHILDFDRRMANLSARAFLEHVVLARFHLKVLVAGPDFAMGRDREGDLGALGRLGEELGFELVPVPALPLGGAPISSSRIRTVVRDGDVALAAHMLGRPYAVEGLVETGAGRGREIGVPTANVAVAPEILLPANGVYVARVDVPGSREPCPAVVNVGIAPTFGGTRRRLEAHLLDFTGNLVGCRLAVGFVERLRGEHRFESIEALTAQIESDIVRARAMLAEEELARVGATADQAGEDPDAGPGG
ncbi:MAG: bifunctional riboflavin kinase/FAD synthetase [Candidatus Eiseniibacteriota bacterium]